MPLRRNNKPPKLDKALVRAAAAQRHPWVRGRVERREPTVWTMGQPPHFIDPGYHTMFPDNDTLEYEPKSNRTMLREMTNLSRDTKGGGYLIPQDIVDSEQHHIKVKANMLLKIFPQLNYDVAYKISRDNMSSAARQALSKHHPDIRD